MTYWQLQVRTADGHEDTVDRLYTIDKVQKVYRHLIGEGWRPIGSTAKAIRGGEGDGVVLALGLKAAIKATK